MGGGGGGERLAVHTTIHTPRGTAHMSQSSSEITVPMKPLISISVHTSYVGGQWNSSIPE